MCFPSRPNISSATKFCQKRGVFRMLSSDYVPSDTGHQSIISSVLRSEEFQLQYNYDPYSVASFLYLTQRVLRSLFCISDNLCLTWQDLLGIRMAITSDYCHVSQTPAKCIACHFSQEQPITSTANDTQIFWCKKAIKTA
jgi:hypothetical protein